MHSIKKLLPQSCKIVIKRWLLNFRRWTAAYRILPNFIIIGAQKSGTGSLYRYLLEHPDIFPALRKEIRYFDRNFSRGLNWYRYHFPSRASRWFRLKIRKKAFLTGEATPEYLFLPHVARRMRALLPGIKLIVLLRNPAIRAYSHYQHKVRHEVEQLPFDEALACEDDRISGERARMIEDEKFVSAPLRHFSYLARGVYVDQLKEWLEIFSEEQILIIRSEDLFEDPTKIYDKVISFLGLPKHRLQNPRNYSAGRYEAVSPATHSWLKEYFKPHNLRLADFIGRDFHWG